jgi:hypothetical protein
LLSVDDQGIYAFQALGELRGKKKIVRFTHIVHQYQNPAAPSRIR